MGGVVVVGTRMNRQFAQIRFNRSVAFTCFGDPDYWRIGRIADGGVYGYIVRVSDIEWIKLEDIETFCLLPKSKNG
jgi:hypothetical protein